MNIDIYIVQPLRIVNIELFLMSRNGSFLFLRSIFLAQDIALRTLEKPGESGVGQGELGLCSVGGKAFISEVGDLTESKLNWPSLALGKPLSFCGPHMHHPFFGHNYTHASYLTESLWRSWV